LFFFFFFGQPGVGRDERLRRGGVGNLPRKVEHYKRSANEEKHFRDALLSSRRDHSSTRGAKVCEKRKQKVAFFDILKLKTLKKTKLKLSKN